VISCHLPRVIVCSTPFGITEVGITGPLHAAAAGHVLNAFRHHRGGHREAFNQQIKRVACSTPFGITEVGIPSPDGGE